MQVDFATTVSYAYKIFLGLTFFANALSNLHKNSIKINCSSRIHASLSCTTVIYTGKLLTSLTPIVKIMNNYHCSHRKISCNRHCMHICLHAYMQCLFAYMVTCLHAVSISYMLTCNRNCMHACMQVDFATTVIYACKILIGLTFFANPMSNLHIISTKLQCKDPC